MEIEPLGTNKKGYIRVKQADINENTIIVLRGLNKIIHMSKVYITATTATKNNSPLDPQISNDNTEEQLKGNSNTTVR